MLSFKQFKQEMMLKEDKVELPGTYAAVRPDQTSMKRIADLMSKYQISNPEPVEKLHCTLLYSRKHLPNYIPDPKLTFIAIPTNLEIWPTKSGKNCLVLKFDSPALQVRHKELMTAHKASYDYDEYKTHISLSYDAGDFDISKIDFSLISHPMNFSNEYQEDLDVVGK